MIKNRIWDIFFPRRCTFCDRVLPFGRKGVCEECRKKIRYLKGPLCCKCGKPVRQEEEYCGDCQKKRHYFKAGRAVFAYPKIRDSLYRFKYMGRQEYTAVYGSYMAHCMGEVLKQWKPEALVPVPLHKRKLRSRGYNQAELLAEELSRHVGIPVCKNLVIRTKNTRPMKGINGTDRQNNVKKAFKIRGNDVKLNTIVIIDDIYTTGSTIDAIAEVCKEAGITNIYFLTLATGEGVSGTV